MPSHGSFRSATTHTDGRDRMLDRGTLRDFVTSLSTLKSSGAGYFEALLPASMKGRNRARATTTSRRAADRDPDLFGELPRGRVRDAQRAQETSRILRMTASRRPAASQAVDALVAAPGRMIRRALARPSVPPATA